MKHFGSVTILLAAALAVAGCSGLNVTQPDYDKLPGHKGSNDSGPGVFGLGKGNYHGGYLVYSSDPSKNSPLGPKAKPKPSGNNTQQNSGQTTSPQGNPGYAPNSSEEKQFRQFQEFQAYQHYRQFEELPNNASERKKFKEWKDWQQYKQWKRQSDQQPHNG